VTSIHHRNIFRKIGTTNAQGMMGMVAYLGGVHRLHLGAGIMFSKCICRDNSPANYMTLDMLRECD